MVQAFVQSMLVDYFGSPHLLLMQRDKQQAQELQDYLERQGFRVSITLDGETTRHLIYSQRPDLLIMDLVMPDIDSFALCQELKSDLNLDYLPVIMMTESQEDHQRLAGMLSGADEYLTKPIVPKELLLRVQTLMRIRRHIEDLIDQNRTLTTNLEERNAELEEAQEVAEQVRMLQRHFIHNVNHEFRTPLLQIKSSIAMLSDIVNDEVNNPKAHQLAEMATQATARLESIFQNITQFEIFENIRREPMVLKHSINSSIKHFQRSWAYHDIPDRIEAFLGVEVPLVLGDQRAVSRLLIHLIDNAIKFSPEDKPVEINVRLLKDSGQVWLAVKDYGIGIPSDKLADIFNPFVQLDAGSTREFGGLGVGLAIARMLAKGMGTTIEVKSEVGKGSIFSITLPVCDLDNL